MYWNTRLCPGDPEAYAAVRSVSPVSSSRVGVPPVVSTVTVSSNVTVTLITEPIPYVSSASGEETESTVGRTPSTTSRLAWPESRLPGTGVGNARAASLPAGSSLIAPPLRSMAASEW